MNKTLVKALLAVAIGAGGLGVSAGTANAYVACSRGGECWHVDRHYRYREPGIVVHPDDWYFHNDWDHGRYRWRREEHRDRGFWRGGVWVPF